LTSTKGLVDNPFMGKDTDLLTQTELELMNYLWEIKSGSVRDILEKLPPNRNLAYTSVSTIIRILEKKGHVKSKKVGKGHIYEPVISKNNYEQKEAQSLLENLFDGSGLSLIKCLIDNKKINQKDLIELQKIINERIK